MPEVKVYKTDFILMHRAMRKWLPDFQGTKGKPQSTEQAKTEVTNNISRLESCDQEYKEALILDYHFSREDLRNYLSSIRKDKSDAIDWMLRNRRDLCRELMEDTIDLTKIVLGREKPETRRVISFVETRISCDLQLLESAYSDAVLYSLRAKVERLFV